MGTRETTRQKLATEIKASVISYTCRDAASLRNSCTTDANASGFTPASHNFTQIDKDSGSRPVLSSLEISTKAETK